MYKLSTYLVVIYFLTYLPMHETYFLHNGLSRWNHICTNSFEVHWELSNNRHPLDDALGRYWFTVAENEVWCNKAGQRGQWANTWFSWDWVSSTKAKEIYFSYLKPYQSKSTYAQYVILQIKIAWRKVNDAGLAQQNRLAFSHSYFAEACKWAQQKLTSAIEECNKYDMTAAAPCFWFANL